MKQQDELRKTMGINDTTWQIHLDRRWVKTNITDLTKDSATITFKVAKNDLQKDLNGGFYFTK